MTDKGKLYEIMGELMYAVAMADGVIQDSEKEELERIIADHPWASTIKWSFEYEFKKHHSVNEVYHKVLSFCEAHGPAPEYVEFIDVITRIADASDGIDNQEMALIENFSRTLSEKFIEDLDKLHE